MPVNRASIMPDFSDMIYTVHANMIQPPLLQITL